MNIERTQRMEAQARASELKEQFASGYLEQWQGLRQWAVWKREREGQQDHKVPYNPGRPIYRASIKNKESWGTLPQALAAFSSGNFAGIGFMVIPPYAFVDLDHSYDRQTRTIIKPEAERIITSLDSVTEASPGAGLHIYVQATPPGKNIHVPDFELYTNWFTTITGDHIPDTPITPQTRQEHIAALYQQYKPAQRETSQNTRGVMSGAAQREAYMTELPPEAGTDRVLQRLLTGDITEFTSASSADYVLLMKLLHWTGDNITLTRQLFLASPLGQREKAQRQTGPTTYVDMTIRNVLKKRNNRPMDR